MKIIGRTRHTGDFHRTNVDAPSSPAVSSIVEKLARGFKVDRFGVSFGAKA